MTDNLLNASRSYRNHCDIHFIREHFRFREKPPTRIAYWKIISFLLLVTVFFLLNLKIRIYAAKVKYSKNLVERFIHGYTELDKKVCSELQFLHSKSIYCLFKTLSNDFHRIPKRVEAKSQTKPLFDDPFVDYEEEELIYVKDVGEKVTTFTGKKIKKQNDPVKDYNILPVMIIVLLIILTGKTVWDVTGNMTVAKKKPSLSTVSRRPSLRQNLYRKMSETGASSVRRTSYQRQSSQPDIKRRLSLVKEVWSIPNDLTRQSSAPAYMYSPDGLRRAHAVDYSSEDDPTSPESKRRIRMIRRY